MQLQIMLFHLANVAWTQSFVRIDASGIALNSVAVDLKECSRSCFKDSACSGFSVDGNSVCSNLDDIDLVKQANDLIVFRKSAQGGSCPSGTKYFTKFTISAPKGHIEPKRSEQATPEPDQKVTDRTDTTRWSSSSSETEHTTTNGGADAGEESTFGQTIDTNSNAQTTTRSTTTTSTCPTTMATGDDSYCVAIHHCS